jgi:TRAP-type mannitol/chloroaromatic compound transport system permease large subunit
MLGPVADKMGIDLVWFGVMICVNMQTSFMHPPFGFALFYLRGISDSMFKNGALPAKVESNDITLGSIPFIVLQPVWVAFVIAFPQTITALLDNKVVYDMDKVEIPMTTSDNAAPDTQESIEELFKSADKPASAPK